MRRLRPLLVLALGALVALSTGCGAQKEFEIAQEQGGELYRGQVLFYERCSGCHTLDAAASQGSKPARQRGSGERTNGPNLNVRQEAADDVLYAIRNGGFSGAIMPANIVTGRDAEAVAQFVARYAGTYNDKGAGADQGEAVQGTTPEEARGGEPDQPRQQEP